MTSSPTTTPGTCPIGPQHVAAPLPLDELTRLKSLAGYALLDTAPEAEYDELTALAAQLCDVPMAAVSVLDVGRQCFKASVGLAVPETTRDVSFCAWAVLRPTETLVVPDATADPRFAGNPLVTEPGGLRFYAGVPLVTSDTQPVGALCVLDTRPRTLSTGQLDALRTVANQVVAQLELRRSRLEGFALRERLDRLEQLVGFPGRTA